MQKQKSRSLLSFSLRGFFIALTLFAIYLGYQTNIVRARQKLWKELQSRPEITFNTELDAETGIYDVLPAKLNPKIPWVRRLLGDRAVYQILLHRYVQGITAAEEEEMKRVFPEASVSEVYFHPPAPQS